MYRLLIVLLMISSSCAGYAQTDARTRALDTKPGLDKQITLTMRAATLREVLDKVEAETGVKLRPEREVTDDKCSISVKEKPARDVLRAIAKCFNLCWADTEGTSSQYLSLCTDKEYRKSMDRMLYEDYSAIIGQIDDETKMMADALKAKTELKFDPEAAKGLPEDQVSRMFFRQMFTSNPSYGSMIVQYRRLTEGQKKDLFAGKEVTIPKESICQEARELYPEATSYTFWIVASLNGYLLQGTVQPEFEAHDWTLITMAIFDDSRYDKTIDAANALLAKDTDLAKELLKPAETSPSTTQQAPASGSQAVQTAFRPTEQNPVLAVPKPGEGSGATPTTMSDGLLPVAEAAGIPVVAQYLSEYAPDGSSKPQAGKIADRLGALSKTHKFTVEKDGGFLLAHSLLWHRLRDREVPEATIKRWQKAVTGLPLPTFEVSVEMANLSWGQVRGVITNRTRWFGMYDLSMIASSEYALKLYASLTAAQQRRIGEGRPVMVSELKPAQWHTFMQAFEMKARPSYVKAQNQSWPQVSSISLGPSRFTGISLYAVSGMRMLGSEDARKHADQWAKPLVVNTESGHIAQMQDAQMILPGNNGGEVKAVNAADLPAVLKSASDTLIGRISTEHPETPKKGIRVYGIFQVAFNFQIGDTKQDRSLACCMPIQ